MDYTEFKYLWPPRPETKVARPMLGFYQNLGWYAQKKKNGTCTVIFARGKEVIFKTRHGDENDGDHRMWTPNAEHKRFFSGSEGWNVFVAELLHSKVSGGPKDHLYIFDQLVDNGVSLVGQTFDERYQALKARFGGESQDDHFLLHQHVSLAKCFKSGFEKLYTNLKPEDEGLVLKDPKAKLLPCYRADSNWGWQVKCRIPQANYSF